MSFDRAGAREKVWKFLAHFLSRQRQVGFDRLGGDTQNLGDLSRSQALTGTEVENLPLSGRQVVHGHQGPGQILLPLGLAVRRGSESVRHFRWVAFQGAGSS